jgi:hypothetical protein
MTPSGIEAVTSASTNCATACPHNVSVLPQNVYRLTCVKLNINNHVTTPQTTSHTSTVVYIACQYTGGDLRVNSGAQ